MHSFRTFTPGPVYMGRLAHGSDIIQGLQAFCAEYGVRTGWVSVMGALRKATLSYYDQEQHRYCNQDFLGDREIVSGFGNISLREGVPMVHLHMVLSDSEFHTVAGHLVPGSTEIFACEFVLQSLEGADPLVRTHDDETGLTLW